VVSVFDQFCSIFGENSNYDQNFYFRSKIGFSQEYFNIGKAEIFVKNITFENWNNIQLEKCTIKKNENYTVIL